MAETSPMSPGTGSPPRAPIRAAASSERASARTSWPSARSRSISLPPMKPDPPVTNALGTVGSLLAGWGSAVGDQRAEPLRIDVPAREDHPDARAGFERQRAGQERRQPRRAARLEYQLEPLEGEPHRRHELL